MKPQLDELKDRMYIAFLKPSKDITQGRAYKLFKYTRHDGIVYLRILDDAKDQRTIARIYSPNPKYSRDYIGLGHDMDFEIVDDYYMKPDYSKPDYRKLKAGQHIKFFGAFKGITPNKPYVLEQVKNRYGIDILRIHDDQGNVRGIAKLTGEDKGYFSLGDERTFILVEETTDEKPIKITLSANDYYKLQEKLETYLNLVEEINYHERTRNENIAELNNLQEEYHE